MFPIGEAESAEMSFGAVGALRSWFVVVACVVGGADGWDCWAVWSSGKRRC